MVTNRIFVFLELKVSHAVVSASEEAKFVWSEDIRLQPESKQSRSVAYTFSISCGWFQPSISFNQQRLNSDV